MKSTDKAAAKFIANALIGGDIGQSLAEAWLSYLAMVLEGAEAPYGENIDDKLLVTFMAGAAAALGVHTSNLGHSIESDLKAFIEGRMGRI